MTRCRDHVVLNISWHGTKWNSMPQLLDNTKRKKYLHWMSLYYSKDESRTYMEWESTFCQSILDAPKTHAAGTNWKVTKISLTCLTASIKMCSKYKGVTYDTWVSTQDTQYCLSSANLIVLKRQVLSFVPVNQWKWHLPWTGTWEVTNK
jgi:hypothetical protein